MSTEKIIRTEPSPRYSRRVNRSNNSSDSPSNSSDYKSDISIINSSNRFEVIYTDIEKLTAYSDQARTHFDDDEIIALAKTIQDHGIRNPLTVIGADEGFQVVSGERRLRAAKIAGLKFVPIIIINDDKKAEELALIENIQRVDLHPIELGRAYSKIMSNTRENPQELANRISVPFNQVYEYSAYSKIPESLSNLIIKHNLGRRAFLRQIIKLSPREMENLIQNEIKLKDEISLDKNENVKNPKIGNNSNAQNRNKKSTSVNLLSIKIIDESINVEMPKLLKQSEKNLKAVKRELEIILNEINQNLEIL